MVPAQNTDQRQKTVRIITFGCKVNQYESQAIREDLEDHGYRIADDHENPDLVVVNTCTVTHQSDRKSRKAIRRKIRNHPDARVVVVGCYAENSPEEIRSIEGVDDVLSHNDKSRVGERVVSGEKQTEERDGTPDLMRQQVEGLKDHTRAWLKVEDGCNLFCHFCIIPYVRGGPRSKPVETVLEEVEDLADSGYKEVVITGIHVGCYGEDLGADGSLRELITALGKQQAVPRIRLSSIEANELDGPLIEALADAPNVVPHLHIPLQAGSDSVLERMNRRYTVDEYRETVSRVRDYMERPAITTDIIVGFPGETDEDFDRTLELANELEFARIHTFSYSDREGTPAAEMEPKIEPDVQQKRVDQLERLNDVLQKRYRKQFMGERVRVLVEGKPGTTGRQQGLTPRYIRTQFQDPEPLQNEIVTVEVDGMQGHMATGRRVPSSESSRSLAGAVQ